MRLRRAEVIAPYVHSTGTEAEKISTSKMMQP